jgi:hypothetical protein
MNSPFDILKKEPEGSFRWVEAVNDLEFANIRIKELIALSPSTLCLTNARITSFLPPHQVFDLTPEGNDHYAQAHLPPQVTQSRFVSAKERRS